MVQTTQEEACISKWNAKTKNLGDIKVIYINHNLVDIFYTDGWENATRVKLDRKAKSFSFTNQEHRSNRYLRLLIEKLLGDI